MKKINNLIVAQLLLGAILIPSDAQAFLRFIFARKAWKEAQNHHGQNSYHCYCAAKIPTSSGDIKVSDANDDWEVYHQKIWVEGNRSDAEASCENTCKVTVESIASDEILTEEAQSLVEKFKYTYNNSELSSTVYTKDSPNGEQLSNTEIKHKMCGEKADVLVRSRIMKGWKDSDWERIRYTRYTHINKLCVKHI
jgi:hypothetical protein